MSSKWQGSQRRANLPPNWATLRAQALTRDGHQCRRINNGARCSERATDVDHVQRGNDHRLANLESLCTDHHKVKTSAEGHAARWHAMPSRKRPDEPHPGLL